MAPTNEIFVLLRLRRRGDSPPYHAETVPSEILFADRPAPKADCLRISALA